MPRLSASSAIFNAGIDDGDQSQPSDLVERATADPDLTQPQRALKQSSSTPWLLICKNPVSPDALSPLIASVSRAFRSCGQPAPAASAARAVEHGLK
jgi:hypothetical protein